MTLRQYLLRGFNGDEKDLFINDLQAFFAQSWDIEAFCQKYLKKSVKAAKKSEVEIAFRALLEYIEPEEISYEEIFDSEIDNEYDNTDQYIYLDGGVKKKRLIYNENYDQVSEED